MKQVKLQQVPSCCRCTPRRVTQRRSKTDSESPFEPQCVIKYSPIFTPYKTLLCRFQTPTTTRGDGCLSEMAELYWKCFCWVKSSGERLITLNECGTRCLWLWKQAARLKSTYVLFRPLTWGESVWLTLPNSRLLSYVLFRSKYIWNWWCHNRSTCNM